MPRYIFSILANRQFAYKLNFNDFPYRMRGCKNVQLFKSFLA
jgi:hypothetical protein